MQPSENLLYYTRATFHVIKVPHETFHANKSIIGPDRSHHAPWCLIFLDFYVGHQHILYQRFGLSEAIRSYNRFDN